MHANLLTIYNAHRESMINDLITFVKSTPTQTVQLDQTPYFTINENKCVVWNSLVKLKFNKITQRLDIYCRWAYGLEPSNKKFICDAIYDVEDVSMDEIYDIIKKIK